MPVRESVLDIRQPADVDAVVHSTPWGCREGTVILSQPVSDHIGQIILTSGSSATSDTHVVQKSGLDWLEPGELVLVRPYAGNYFERFEESLALSALWGSRGPSMANCTVMKPTGTSSWLFVAASGFLLAAGSLWRDRNAQAFWRLGSTCTKARL